MTEVVRTDMGFGIIINGEIVEDGFLNERSAKRAVRNAEFQYALTHDADYIEFNAYRSAMAQVKFWQDIRASVGETISPEDIITMEDYEISVDEASKRIAVYQAEADKHYDGAKRWADSCRIAMV